MKYLVFRACSTAFVACIALHSAFPQNQNPNLNRQVNQTVTLRNGLQYEGLFATIAEYQETLEGGPVIERGLFSIAMVDDGLRRIYFHKDQIPQVPVPVERPFQRVPVWQELSVGQSKIWREGNLIRSEPFNELGHRVVTTRGALGGGTFVQAITEITPTFCRVAAIRDQDWEMRIATSSIPSDVLIKLMRRQIADPNSITKRLEIVDLLLQAQRYQEANVELKSIQEDFPDLTQEIAAKREILSQQFARQVLGEIRTRIANGQTELGLAMTQRITGPNVSAEILADVLALSKSIQQSQEDVARCKQLLQQQVDLLSNDGKLSDEATAEISVALDEIRNELNPTNLERLATFVRLSSDAEQSPSSKIAYAISGWIVGSGAATDNLAVALALIHVRRLTREYLTTSQAERRGKILAELSEIEAGDPPSLARVIQNLTPPQAPSAEIDLRQPLEFTIDLPGIPAEPGERSAKYLIQLPPQYDRYRRYPCIVALHSEGQSLAAQLQWWTGEFNPNLNMAMGQASRHGYIVIAPAWDQNGRDYEFSALEQLAVLRSLRDAERRFSIDTDRIFLTGHFAGGDAAWDIGMSYPDIWAGVIPISAASGPGGHYARRCHETIARSNLAFYFVAGQKDLGRIVDNKLIWNEWLTSKDFDVTLVEYQGRLAETFAEELPALFEWMALHKRIVPVPDFTGRSLRPWVRQFWWLEVDKIPAKDVVLPIHWPPKTDMLAVRIEGKYLSSQNKFIVRAFKDSRVTLWLLPELVDFGRLIEVSGRGTDFRGMVSPNRQVLLEDVRRRADRQHPYWARLVCERSTWRAE